MENFKRGQIVWIDLPEKPSDKSTHVQCGRRPALILSNDKANAVSPVLSVAAITSREKKPLPVHVKIETEHNGLSSPSTCLLEQIQTVDKSLVVGCIDKATGKCMQQVNKAVCIQLQLL